MPEFGAYYFQKIKDEVHKKILQVESLSKILNRLEILRVWEIIDDGLTKRRLDGSEKTRLNFVIGDDVTVGISGRSYNDVVKIDKQSQQMFRDQE